MKKLAFLFLPIVILLCSCNDDDIQSSAEEDTIVGTWQLVERYADPGDGNGTWQPVENGKVVQINADGTWTCNYSICNTDNTSTSSGTYTTSEFESTDCTVSYRLEDDNLDLLYSCIEACTGRFERI